MFYLEKAIETESGAIANCWVITDKKDILYRQQPLMDEEGNPLESINPSEFFQTGSVVLIGYKDKAAWLAGKLPLSKPKVVSLGDLTQYEDLYQACQQKVIEILLGTEEFSGAVLKNTDEE